MACPDCGAKKGHMGGCPNDQGKKGSRYSPTNVSKPLSSQEKKEGIEIRTCPTCVGTGRRGVRKCGLCGGVGKIRVTK